MSAFVNINVEYECEWNDAADLRPENFLPITAAQMEPLLIPHDLPSAKVFSLGFFTDSSHSTPLLLSQC